MKKTTAAILCLIFAISLFSYSYATTDPKLLISDIRQESAKEEMRGVWFSFKDYERFGLTVNNGEDYFRAKVNDFLNIIEGYGINTVFLHVRAFDDAFWKSNLFHASQYVGGDENLPAKDAYPFDPAGVFLKEAHLRGFSVHAWINPYRITQEIYYDPALDSSIERVVSAVQELLNFEYSGERFDGIHMDDYFYHSKGGYCSDPAYVYEVDLSAEAKRNCVNRMVKEVFDLCHMYGKKFGISPAGNYDNDMNSGADIDTWLSEDGFVDYLIPQIYWTNQYGADGNTRLFSERLDQFLEKKKNNTDLYVGLALYRCGSIIEGDIGWSNSNTNMVNQIAELREKGCNGYVFFTAASFIEPAVEAERKEFLQTYVANP